MAGKKKADGPDEIIYVTRNRRAAYEYELIETLECGMVLVGTEVKTLREGHCLLEDAYARLQGDELWLIGCEIPEYSFGNRLNHKPKRDRKLLIHRREIGKFANNAAIKGFTLIPVAVYFKNGRAKVQIAVARGKQLHDKRQSVKEKQAKRDIAREVSRRR